MIPLQCPAVATITPGCDGTVTQSREVWLGHRRARSPVLSPHGRASMGCAASATARLPRLGDRDQAFSGIVGSHTCHDGSKALDLRGTPSYSANAAPCPGGARGRRSRHARWADRSRHLTMMAPRHGLNSEQRVVPTDSKASDTTITAGFGLDGYYRSLGSDEHSPSARSSTAEPAPTATTLSTSDRDAATTPSRTSSLFN